MLGSIKLCMTDSNGEAICLVGLQILPNTKQSLDHMLNLVLGRCATTLDGLFTFSRGLLGNFKPGLMRRANRRATGLSQLQR